MNLHSSLAADLLCICQGYRGPISNQQGGNGCQRPRPCSSNLGAGCQRKKQTTLFVLTKKGTTSFPIRQLRVQMAPTESPKRFPKRSLPRRCRDSPSVLLPVQRLPPPATAFPTPGAGCCCKATPSQGRAGGREVGCGRARLGLDWRGTLEQPHGRLLPAAGCGRGLRQCRWSRLDLLSLPLGLLQPLTKAK